MAQKLKPKVLVVVYKVCYMPKIIHVDFRCGTGCYTAGYSATWQLLCHNLTSEILHPSRVKSYSAARQRVLKILFDHL
ncbi:hypothetical protein RHMOL_Rhmol02G0229900 [Rhododendron molle]|uniref:Uncharacterized protein n=1 Tax=Rhododendron molle TaxID=49168 RepID=A0ACC0PSZ8_RHOML|nr:hypothetical protein RHMOL_Rhmol02G0229900 [Rhododendron molle]